MNNMFLLVVLVGQMMSDLGIFEVYPKKHQCRLEKVYDRNDSVPPVPPVMITAAVETPGTFAFALGFIAAALSSMLTVPQLEWQ